MKAWEIWESKEEYLLALVTLKKDFEPHHLRQFIAWIIRHHQKEMLARWQKYPTEQFVTGELRRSDDKVNWWFSFEFMEWRIDVQSRRIFLQRDPDLIGYDVTIDRTLRFRYGTHDDLEQLGSDLEEHLLRRLKELAN